MDDVFVILQWKYGDMLKEQDVRLPSDLRFERILPELRELLISAHPELTVKRELCLYYHDRPIPGDSTPEEQKIGDGSILIIKMGEMD